jgi:hypothetical protein
VNPNISSSTHPQAATGAFRTAKQVYQLAKLVADAVRMQPLGMLITLILAEEDPDPDWSDPQQLASTLAGVCRAKGASEIYMPLCQSNEHSDVGDVVKDAGYWHGDISLDYWSAYNQAAAHFTTEPTAVGQVGVVRVQADAPSIVDWIILE